MTSSDRIGPEKPFLRDFWLRIVRIFLRTILEGGSSWDSNETLRRATAIRDDMGSIRRFWPPKDERHNPPYDLADNQHFRPPLPQLGVLTTDVGDTG